MLTPWIVALPKLLGERVHHVSYWLAVGFLGLSLVTFVRYHLQTHCPHLIGLRLAWVAPSLGWVIPHISKRMLLLFPLFPLMGNGGEWGEWNI
eukprot:SAG31_NODE_1474_length_8205_cov_27.248335_5_plen_92_part_01